MNKAHFKGIYEELKANAGGGTDDELAVAALGYRQNAGGASMISRWTNPKTTQKPSEPDLRRLCVYFMHLGVLSEDRAREIYDCFDYTYEAEFQSGVSSGVRQTPDEAVQPEAASPVGSPEVGIIPGPETLDRVGIPVGSVPAPIKLEWHLFHPLVVGCAAASNALDFFGTPQGTFVAYGQRLSSCHLGQEFTLDFYPTGGLTIHWRIAIQFPSVSAFALERRRQYQAVLSRSAAPMRQLLARIHELAESTESEPHVIPLLSQQSYCLSVAVLNSSYWSGTTLANGLKLLSCPNLLLTDVLTEDEVPSYASAADFSRSLALERHYLDSGIDSPDILSFSVGQTVLGYASWSGVALCCPVPAPTQLVQTLLDFESALQAMWWVLSTLRDWRSSNSSVLVDAKYRATLESHMQHLLRIGPTETIMSRLSKEMIIKSSRVLELWQEFQAHTGRR